MAQSATVHKVHLQLADMDRHHYADYSHTLAQHPSETEERLMMRLLAFMLRADERLEFTRGLCVDDEPDLWCKSYADEIELWVEVGLPSDKRIRKACNRARQVVILAYGSEQAVTPWWEGVRGQLYRFDNLEVLRVSPAQSADLTALAERGMHLQCSIEDGQVWVSNADSSVILEPLRLWPEA
ncbi:YaeQ family protein [Marinobacterium weihaiense]|uniref:YaeQ family protein n=1 Tax=Marinobacterium weihaiense TaxID=2851016 RepID=A0ABS6MAQ4_9GAMM|nr:YaeQ family protein [Marinobacterium weihaiense]MBV0932974.1 YaeQ family protein [Marinobacterium weihaiense]